MVRELGISEAVNDGMAIEIAEFLQEIEGVAGVLEAGVVRRKVGTMFATNLVQ